MNREERERRERQQRMLRREQGGSLPEGATLGTQGNSPGVRVPKRVRRSTADAPKTTPPPQPAAPRSNLRPVSELIHRRQRRRRIFWTVVVLVAALVFAGFTGVLGNSLAMLSDVADTVYLSINQAGGGWPVNTGIQEPLQVEELAGGFVVMDSKDVAVYSAYGVKVRSIQPGYARPALAVGNTRFVVYNRGGTELTVGSRTRDLYNQKLTNAIMLCSIANNGTLAIVTESERYTAEVQIYDPSFRDIYSWYLTQSEGTPVVLQFASDNHRFAAGTIAARDGQLATTLYLMDTATEGVTATYAADTGSMVVSLEWISSRKLLAVFDDYLALIDPSTGAELGRYNFDGAALQSVSANGSSVALLLSVRGGNNLVTLDEGLTPLAIIPAGQAETVCCTQTEVYLLSGTVVECYGFDGVQRWQQTLDARPVTVLDAAQTLVFAGGYARVLTAP